MPTRLAIVLLAFAFLAGCDEKPTPSPSPAPTGSRTEAGRFFDPHSAGTVVGRVVWRGKRPVVPPLRSVENPLDDQVEQSVRDWPNPNAPAIDPHGGVGSAVVCLRGVDPARGRRWDHPPVRVELSEHRFHVLQGGQDRNIGLVCAGDEIEVVSKQPVFHSVRGRGADFFSLSLPYPEQPRRRRLSSPGVVELASAAGFFWMRAYLFVAPHPCCTLPDARGSFRLDGVPPGEYDLVAWHPGWRIAAEERNHESFRIQQVRFEDGASVSSRVRVEPGRTVSVDVELGASR